MIGANFFQVQNGKIVYMRTIHDSLPFQPFVNQTVLGAADRERGPWTLTTTSSSAPAPPVAPSPRG